jgi:8-oxo-dGTP pyrophosphatase MutT (NUDIX family)
MYYMKREKISSMPNKKVVVGFIFQRNKFLLIKHKRKNMWLPVGGHMEPKEKELEALEREILEEVGLKVEIDSEPFYLLKKGREITSHYICYFQSGKIILQKEEILEFKWWTKKQALKSIQISEKLKEIISKLPNLK